MTSAPMMCSASNHRAGQHREEDRQICQALGSNLKATSHDLGSVPGFQVQREKEHKGIKPPGDGDGRLACLADVCKICYIERNKLWDAISFT